MKKIAVMILIILTSLMIPKEAVAADNMCNVNPGTCFTPEQWIQGWFAARQPENQNSVPQQPEYTQRNEENRGDQPPDRPVEIIRLPTEPNSTNRSDIAAQDAAARGGDPVNPSERTKDPVSLNPVTLQPTALPADAAPGTPLTGSGPAAGTAAGCYGLGGGANNQTERDCLAGATSGTYSSGQCRGLSVAACAALGRAVYCSGRQEAAGSSRAGEFLDCGKSSTGGCGQVDVYDANNNLIGFVIDKSNCGGAAPTTVTPSAPDREIPPPTDGGGPPPPPPPPPGGVVCGSLGKDVGAPELNQTVVFTCTGNFSAVDPVYEFRHRVNSGSYTVVAGTPNADKTRATAQVTISQTGTWEAQCRVCTDASKTSCTTWGQAQ